MHNIQKRASAVVAATELNNQRLNEHMPSTSLSRHTNSDPCRCSSMPHYSPTFRLLCRAAFTTAPAKVHASAAPGSCDQPRPGMADSLSSAEERPWIPYVGRS